MSTLPTGTVTFLFTDLEGSTQLWETQPEAMRVDLARHDALLRDIIRRHGGHVFKTVGDAFCTAFLTAETALVASVAVQCALMGETWEVGGAGLRARIGLHTGEAQEREGDYFGRTPNRTARMRDAAHGGQIVLSLATEQLVRETLPPDFSLQSLGAHRLKDLSRPEQIFQLQHPALPDTFPPLRSLNSFPNNLPQRLDSFVGRERELAQIEHLLNTTRLLTLTGVGGAGKTRLAQQAAADCLDRYPEGVWLIPLEALTEPDLVAQAVATAVGIREQPGRPLITTLCEALQAKRALLILDNCEHLIAACAHLAQTLLQACPQVHVLATSRESLAISGEATYAVPTLPVPDPQRFTLSSGSSEAETSEAMRLFADRAALSLPSFVLTPENAAAVARICRQLDGIPLAIELAAPRVKMLTPEQISQRLGNRFRLLTGGSRTALPRQQTMQAAIQWSHDLLSESERALFRRLSVFAGGWTLEAAEQVCTGQDLDELDILDLLSSLLAKSLVQVDEDEDGGRRYRMLETLRDYSLERLNASTDAVDAYEHHQDYFLGLAAQADPELRGPQQKLWGNRLEAEQDNFRAVLARSEGEPRLRLAASLHRFWWMRGDMTEGRKWLREALSEDITAFGKQDVAKALTGAGILAWAQADLDAARAFYGRALALYHELNDEEGVARTLTNLGIVADTEEDPDARRYYEESLAILHRLGDRTKIAFVLVNLAAYHIVQNDPSSSLPLLRECLQIREELGDDSGIATVSICLGQAAYLQGRWVQSRDAFRRSLAIRRDLGEQRGVVEALCHLSRAEAALNNLADAARLLAASQRLSEALRAPLPILAQQEYEQIVSSLRAGLGDEAYATASQEGRSLPTEQVISHTLRERVTVPTDNQGGSHTHAVQIVHS